MERFLLIDRNYLIIGPTGAGKTHLLASLEVAARKFIESDVDIGGESVPSRRVVLRALNKDMRGLLTLARTAIKEGKLAVNPTDWITTYDFALEVSGRPGSQARFGNRSKNPVTRVARYFLVDGRGEDLFPDGDATESEARTALLERLKVSHGLIICVDGTDTDSCVRFWSGFPQLFKELGVRTLKLERVVVCLTKADKQFFDFARKAHDQARSSPAERFGQRLTTEVLLGTLREYTEPSTEVGFVWTSAYGFIPDEGTANYDPDRDRLRLYTEGDATWEEAIANWVPFQTLEPLLFLAKDDVSTPGIKVVLT